MAKKENKEEVKNPTRNEAIASTQGIRITPRKMRLVVDAIRGKDLAEAYGILENTNKRACKVIYKTVKSAEANAVHNFHMDASTLYIAVIHADDGPRLKRFEPRAKGSSSPIIKRMSSVTVVLKSKGAK
jgi:large subunit ribosomal protein L22